MQAERASSVSAAMDAYMGDYGKISTCCAEDVMTFTAVAKINQQNISAIQRQLGLAKSSPINFSAIL